jgi:hypothetical protein
MTKDQITQKVQVKMQELWDDEKSVLENAWRIQKRTKSEYERLLMASSVYDACNCRNCKEAYREIQNELKVLIHVQKECQAIKLDSKME